MAANNMPLPLDMVQVSPAYLQIIRQVGAKGRSTSQGELFTLKELCFYLKEYIKQKCLYNPIQPLEVICRDDPIGKVFGVNKFTFFDAVKHVQKQTRPVILPASTVSTTEPSRSVGQPGEKQDSNSNATNNLPVKLQRQPPIQTLNLKGSKNNSAESIKEQTTTRNPTRNELLQSSCAVNKEGSEIVIGSSSQNVQMDTGLPFKQYSPKLRNQNLALDTKQSTNLLLNQTESQKSGLETSISTLQSFPNAGTNCLVTTWTTSQKTTSSTSPKKVANHKSSKAQRTDSSVSSSSQTGVPEALCSKSSSQSDSPKVTAESDDDEFYFRSQKAANEALEPASQTSNEPGLSLGFMDDFSPIPDQKTPEHQIQSWADVKVPQESLEKKVPSKRLRQAFTFEDRKDENDNVGRREEKDDEGVYDCEPSTSGSQPQDETATVKPKQGLPRRRQSSLSIICTQEPASSSSAGVTYPWYLRLEIENNGDEDDEEEVLSIQSKETMLVKDSSDDYWFLEESDEEEEEDQTPEASQEQTDQFSLHMGGISVEFPSQFEEEYEVDSGTDQDAEKMNGLSEEEESAGEEIIVVCKPPRAACDWDIEFWADSESSDADSSDEEYDDKDKWRCESCDILNPPLHRYCDRCMMLRPDWLPSNPASRQSSPSPVPKSRGSKRRRKQAMYRHTTLPFTPRGDRELPSSQGSDLFSSQGSQGQGQEGSQGQGQERSHGQGHGSQRLDDSQPGPSHSYLNSESLRRMETGQDLPEGHSSQEALNQYLQPLRENTRLCVQPGKNQTSQDGTITESLQHKTKENKEEDSQEKTEKDSQGLSLTSSQEASQFDSSQCLSSSLDLTAESLGPVTTSSDQMSSQNSDVLLRRTDTNDTLPSNEINLQRLDDFRNEEHHLNSLRRSPETRSTQPGTSLKRRVSESADDDNSDGPPTKMIKTNDENLQSTSACSPRKDGSTNSCQLCYNGPKDAVLVHGKSGHQMCCYSCAKRLRRYGKPCPICRRQIQRVIRNFVV